MARMPGAIWRPLAADWASQPRMRAYDFFCLHTMVGGLDGTDGYFRVGNGAGYGGTESHFGVGHDGTIYQWQDTDFQADANGDGNWHVISSENADTGAPFPKWGGSDVPAMTPAQVEANAQIAVWLYRTHGIPLGLTPDSKPGRRGLAVHRWGVPGYMVAGAERWSTSQGKACPGDRRVAQAPQVSARAQQILTDHGGFLMALSDAQQEQMFDRIMGFLAQRYDENGKPARALDSMDGSYLLEHITGGTERTLAEFEREADRDAANQAALTSQLAAVGTDPAVLAGALKAALGEQLAADVAARLTVSAKPATT